jgi:trehalose utilization protein
MSERNVWVDSHLAMMRLGTKITEEIQTLITDMGLIVKQGAWFSMDEVVNVGESSELLYQPENTNREAVWLYNPDTGEMKPLSEVFTLNTTLSAKDQNFVDGVIETEAEVEETEPIVENTEPVKLEELLNLE